MIMLGKCICVGLCLCAAGIAITFMLYSNRCAIMTKNPIEKIENVGVDNALENL
jgi:hypothetical protein